MSGDHGATQHGIVLHRAPAVQADQQCLARPLEDLGMGGSPAMVESAWGSGAPEALRWLDFDPEAAWSAQLPWDDLLTFCVPDALQVPEHGRNRNLAFKTRQMRAETVVDAKAKRDMWIGVAIDHESVGLVEN